MARRYAAGALNIALHFKSCYLLPLNEISIDSDAGMLVLMTPVTFLDAPYDERQSG